MGTIDVEKIAEVVLYEGYLLFPYRRSAMKNQQRWTFGGVYPRRYSEAAGGDDPWRMQTQSLVTGGAETEIEIKLRFLHVIDRWVAENTDGARQFVEALRVGEQVYHPWDEAIERELVLGAKEGDPAVRLGDLIAHPRRFTIQFPAGSEEETLYGTDGAEVGALVREWRNLQGEVEVSAEAAGPVLRLTVSIINTTPCAVTGTDAQARGEVLRQTFVSTHTILRVRDGEFISLLEPPDAFRDAAEACENIKTWPVLVGEPGERHTVLSSPIILYDYPQISPESQGNYFDATEIDELLALSVMTLTDDEKQEMRDSGIHAREILERTESLSEEQLMKMHGSIRYLQPRLAPRG